MKINGLQYRNTETTIKNTDPFRFTDAAIVNFCVYFMYSQERMARNNVINFAIMGEAFNKFLFLVNMTMF